MAGNAGSSSDLVDADGEVRYRVRRRCAMARSVMSCEWHVMVPAEDGLDAKACMEVAAAGTRRALKWSRDGNVVEASDAAFDARWRIVETVELTRVAADGSERRMRLRGDATFDDAVARAEADMRRASLPRAVASALARSAARPARQPTEEMPAAEGIAAKPQARRAAIARVPEVDKTVRSAPMHPSAPPVTLHRKVVEAAASKTLGDTGALVALLGDRGGGPAQTKPGDTGSLVALLGDSAPVERMRRALDDTGAFLAVLRAHEAQAATA